jgi:hypothetical protein
MGQIAIIFTPQTTQTSTRTRAFWQFINHSNRSPVQGVIKETEWLLLRIKSNGSAAAVWKCLIQEGKGMPIIERYIRKSLLEGLRGHKYSALLLGSLSVNVGIAMIELSLWSGIDRDVMLPLPWLRGARIAQRMKKVWSHA